MINKPELEILLKKYINNSINHDEYQLLLTYFSDPDQSTLLDALIMQQLDNEKFSHPEEIEALVLRVDEKIKTRIPSPAAKLSLLKRFYPYVAAAAVLICCFSAYFYFGNKQSVNPTEIAFYDVAAGGNKATLRLSAGQEIILDEKQSQLCSKEEGLTYENGESVFQTGSEVQIYTLETPRKGQYQAVLPDGSRVWLNAESSIHFPSQFTGDSRTVRIEGEVYFEVARDKHKKFIVELSNGNRIEVLGTHFNVNAYKNSMASKTSLLEGSVKFLNNKNKSVILKPGEQAIQPIDAAGITVQKADVMAVISWKDNKFNFEGMPFPEIMRQLERWYDIEVVYASTIPKLEFYGELNRSNSLQYIMKAFADSGVKMELKGRTLLVH